ncbi:MAG: DNA repair exonuclease [Eubacteriales bacterium]|nr:DNA repair exonuclease [Eubacteriales bacterium]
MESIKILHTGDLHLTDKKGDVQAKVFSKIISIAKREAVDALLIAGDLFDYAFGDMSEKSYMASMLSQIPDIPVFMVTGNHDNLSFYKDIQLPENVHLFGNEIDKVSLGKCDIYGVSFKDSKSDESLIKDFHVEDDSRINILLMHGDLDSVSSYNPITPKELAQTGADYVALGHIHTSKGVGKVGSTFYAYCGTPQGRGFDELGTKGVLLGQVHKGFVELEMVPTSEYTYEEIELDISGLEDYNQIAKRIRDNTSSNNYYKIHLIGNFAGGFNLNCDRIINLLEEYPVVKLYDETGTDYDINSIRQEQTLRGFFVNALADDPEATEAIKLGLMALDGKDISLGDDK